MKKKDDIIKEESRLHHKPLENTVSHICLWVFVIFLIIIVYQINYEKKCNLNHDISKNIFYFVIGLYLTLGIFYAILKKNKS